MSANNYKKRRSMTQEQETLWRNIQAHMPGYADASLGFSQRLARDNGWSDAYAMRVVTEYKRFAYLAATLQHPVTPSDQVDQAWHLHLTYTRDYWEVFCPRVLGQPLHHDPTRGGGSEREKFFDWYAKTLAAYRTVFGEPPQDIWPGPERRFAQRFERRQLLDGGTRKSGLARAASFLGALGIAGAAWGAQETARSNLIWFLLVVGVAIVLLIWHALKQPGSRKNDGGGGCGGGGGGGSCDGSGCGCGGGGCGGGCGG
jgi:hypothetical protein